MRKKLELAEVPEEALLTPDHFEQQFAIILEEKVPVISTAFGVLPAHMIKQAKAAGIRIVTMVTTVNEALLAEQAGCDAIVAQGSEAGGHRGTFDISNRPMGANIGTMALVPQIVDRVHIPVIAAGGIMDGRGLVATLALGSQGVQMGTRFLTSIESGAHISYQQKLLTSTEEVGRTRFAVAYFWPKCREYRAGNYPSGTNYSLQNKNGMTLEMLLLDPI